MCILKQDSTCIAEGHTIKAWIHFFFFAKEGKNRFIYFFLISGNSFNLEGALMLSLARKVYANQAQNFLQRASRTLF